MYNPISCEQLTVTSTVALGATVPAGTKRVMIGVDTAAVKFTLAGSAPTTTFGISLAAASVTDIGGIDLSSIMFCSTGSTAKVNLQYFS